MAQANHVLLLRQGPDAVAVWRERYPKQRLDLVEANLSRLNLSGAPLSRANFRWANLSRCGLRSADLSGAHFQRTDVSDSVLTGANLDRAYVTIADFFWTEADATTWRNARLLRANFHQASLAGSQFEGAHVNECVFAGTNLAGADFSGLRSGRNVFADCDLSHVTGLGTVRHSSGSFISVDTLARTMEGAGGAFDPDQIAFFTGAGVPRTLLDYLPSILEAEPIRLFSCFISYCEQDAELATQLHSDLRELGVRCWKYDVDALVGRGVWDNIDKAISLHEKSILICSKSSLERPGVLR